MHGWRTGGNDDAVQAQVINILFNQLLAGIRAHETAIARYHHCIQTTRKASDIGNVNCTGDIAAAVTDIETYPWFTGHT
jgi:hypothetical protein